MILKITYLSSLVGIALAGRVSHGSHGSASLTVRDPIADPRWVPGVKWQIEIQAPVSQTQPLVPEDAVVWDVDLWMGNRTGFIKHTLKPASKIVICYFSAGTIHNGTDNKDPDLEKFRGVKQGNPYPGFEEERWIDINNPAVLEIMKSRIQLAADLGCDGIDPDNIDGYKHDNGLNLTQADFAKYIKSLSDAGKDKKLMVGQKNAPELSQAAVEFLDFAVLEQCLDPEEPVDKCDSWQVYVQRNPAKPVFQIEYPRSVQPCDSQEAPSTCVPDAPIICPQGPVTDQNFTYYCHNNPANNNDSNFSKIIKQDGGACGLGNYTMYCDKNSPLFVHMDEDEGPELAKRVWARFTQWVTCWV